MSVLAEMLRQGLSGIIVAPIRDPEAVDQLINCGEGNEMTLTVGGKYSVPSINQIGCGLNCTGIVKKITDGYMNFKKFAESRKSVRGFLDKPVPKELFDEIINVL